MSKKRLTVRHAVFTSLLFLTSCCLAPAQSTSTQCGDYVEAYKGGAATYSPFLQIAQTTAKTRDGNEHTTRYTSAFQGSSSASNALWLNNWCTKNPLKTIGEASDQLLDELTGLSRAGAPPVQYSPPPSVVVIQPPSARPSACRTGDNGSCSGCSVSCDNGMKATCRPGSETADRSSCAFPSSCDCNVDKKATPSQINIEGVSSCRVGSNGPCSGCSVTCNNGEVPQCKHGSLTANGEQCAFQAECKCKQPRLPK